MPKRPADGSHQVVNACLISLRSIPDDELSQALLGYHVLDLPEPLDTSLSGFQVRLRGYDNDAAPDLLAENLEQVQEGVSQLQRIIGQWLLGLFGNGNKMK